MQGIWEVVVYDGATKVFRIWNITTGTIYSSTFDDEATAQAAIEDGTVRGGRIVHRITLPELQQIIFQYREESVPVVEYEITVQTQRGRKNPTLIVISKEASEQNAVALAKQYQLPVIASEIDGNDEFLVQPDGSIIRPVPPGF